jgi:hypothetical protein
MDNKVSAPRLQSLIPNIKGIVMADNIERVKEPDDPRRCQSTIPSQGQCWLVSVEGTQYCACHGGARAASRLKDESKRIYRVGQWRARLTEHADNNDIKNLREDIGVLRLCIEERMMLCKTPTDLVINSGPLSDLVMKVEKLVSSCDKIETKLGQTLDANQALQFGQEIIEAVANSLEDLPNKEEILGAISDEIAKAFDRLTKGSTESG